MFDNTALLIDAFLLMPGILMDTVGISFDMF